MIKKLFLFVFLLSMFISLAFGQTTLKGAHGAGFFIGQYQSITPHTGVWLDGGVGAGDLTTEIKIYPDCSPSTPLQCTKLLRTDTDNNYIWNICITPSCLINGSVDGGYGWSPIPLPANTTNAQMLAITAGNSSFGQYPGGSEGIAACAWTIDQSQTLIGSTSIIYQIVNGTIASSSTQGTIYVTINKGASWTDTRQAVTVNGVNNESGRQNSPIVWCDPNSSGQIAYVGSYGAALLKTINGGTSWSAVGGGLATPSGDATEVIGDPTSSVVGGVTQGIYAWVQGHGLYSSINGGTTWTAVTATGAPTGNSYYPMKIDKFGQVWMFASGASSPIYKYSGGGASGTWTNLTGICSGGNYASPTFDSTSTSAGTEKIYAWCGNQALYSSNGGSTWSSGLEALLSATVHTGGSGCTTGVQTFTVSGGTSLAGATLIGTVLGGSVSGTLSVVIPGSYMAVPGGNPTITGGGCATSPTIVATWTTNDINKSTATNIPGGGDVKWLSDGPSATTFTDVHDTGLDLAGNFYLSSGYGVYYAAHNSIPIFAVQSVGFESSTSTGLVFAQGLGTTQGSWDTGIFANVVPGLYAYKNFAGSTPSFIQQPLNVAGQKPWISCSANGAPFDGCSNDGGHSFTQWTTAPPGVGPIATTDGTNLLVLSGGKLYCNTTGGVGSWSTVSGPPPDIPEIFEASVGVYEYVLSTQNGNGVWTSSGGCGGTWTEVNTAKQAGFSFGVAGHVGLIVQSGGGGNNAAISTNSGVTFTPLSIQYPATINVGAGKPGSSTAYTIYVVGVNGSTFGTWYSTDGGSTWHAVSTLGLNGFFSYVFVPNSPIAADLDIYGVLVGQNVGTANSVIGLVDSCPGIYWNPAVTYPTMNVTGTVTLTVQDIGLAVPTTIWITVDGITITTFTPNITAGSYSFNWNTNSVATGAHTLTVLSNGNGCFNISKSIPITTH